jgi:tetratricopeptide (TPR) repeat protein
MADDHLSRQVLRDLARGWANGSEVFERWLHHLLELCPECRGEFEAYRTETTHQPAVTHAEALRDALGLSAQTVARWEQERAAADAEVAALLALEPRERANAVSRQRFDQPTVAEVLLEVAFTQTVRSPQQALELAYLAKRVLERTRQSGLVERTYVLALAYAANAARVLGRLEAAREGFRDARFLLRRIADAGDRELRAELNLLECSLLRDQRDFTGAAKLGERALRAYRMLGFAREITSTLLKLGTVYYHQGRLGLARQVTEEALEHLSSTPEDRLYFYARKNLAIWLAELGELGAASKHLEAVRPWVEACGEAATCLRFRWVEGILAERRGDRPSAEEAFLEVHRGFAELSQPYDAASVALQLATLYLVDGRTDEVKELALELVPTFEALGIEREAQMARALYNDAVQQERQSIQ